METEKKISWYDTMLDKFNALMSKFDMPEDMRHEIESFVLGVARDQYTTGNRNGIAWLRKQAGAKRGQILVAMDAPTAAA